MYPIADTGCSRACPPPYMRRETVPLLITLFAGLACFNTWSGRYLFADGSYFFVRLLETEEVSTWYPARQFAHLVTQWPAVTLMRSFGVSNVKTVGIVYGGTLFLWPLVGLLVPWWAARQSPVDAMTLPLLSFSLINLTTSLFIISEAHVAVALFWCGLSLLVFSERLTHLRSVVLLASAFLSTRTYELYLVLAWPLVALSLNRATAAWRAGRRREAAVCAGSAALYLDAFIVAFLWTINPRDASQRSDFLQGIVSHLESIPVWFCIAAIVGALCFQVLPSRNRIGLIVLWIVGVLGLLVSALPYVTPWAIFPTNQYTSRVQTLYVTLILGGLLAWPAFCTAAQARADAGRAGLWKLALGSAIVSFVFQLGVTLDWNRYQARILRELSSRRGVVAYDELSMPEFNLFGTTHRYYTWSWTMQPLSVALSALHLGSVNTIIENPEGSFWKPLDPLDTEAVPDLKKFGVPVLLQYRVWSKKAAKPKNLMKSAITTSRGTESRRSAD